VTNVAASAPLTSSGGTTPSISISQSNSVTDGFLSAADWTLFNNKLGVATGFSGDISGAYNAITIAPGVVTSAKMSATGVSAATYGSATMVPVITVDAAGRISSVSQAAVSGGGGMAALTNGQIWVGNGSNTATGVVLSGDASLTNTGVLSIMPATVTANKMYASAPLKLFGRYTGGAGPGEEISVGPGLSISGGTLMVSGATGDISSTGNSFGVAPNIGTNDAYGLNLKTNNNVRLSIDAAGNVGVGIGSPAVPLDVMGAIRSNGSSGAGNGGVIKLTELGANGTNYTALRAADSISADVVYTLPAADGTNGQVLSTDGTGYMSWITPGGGGTVTNVTGSAPIVVTTGSSTPSISISAATAVSDGYLTSADWNVFNAKLAGSTVFAGDISGSYNATFITPGAVTASKISSGAVDVSKMYSTGGMALFGKSTGGAGPANEISVGMGLTLSAGSLSADLPEMSDMLGASLTNSFDNGAYNQGWSWNSLAAGAGLSLSSSSAFSGNLFEVTGSGAVTGAQMLVQNDNLASGGRLIDLRSASGSSQAVMMNIDTSAGIGIPMKITQNSVGSMSIALQNTNTSYGSGVQFLNSAGTQSAALELKGTSGSPTWTQNSYALYTKLSNDLVLGTNAVERMRISSGGNISISGATQISGNGPALVVNGGVGTNSIVLNNASIGTSQRGALEFQKNGASKWEIGTDFGQTGTSDFYIRDNVAALNRIQINPAGKVGIGNPAPQAQLDVSGHIGSTGGPTVTLGACGTGTIAANSTDTRGKINLGASPPASSCLVNFGQSFSGNAPFCVVSWSDVNGNYHMYSTTTTTTMTVGFGSTPAANSSFTYICMQ
jgi:trimeric autotransporter adhesin